MYIISGNLIGCRSFSSERVAEGPAMDGHQVALRLRHEGRCELKLPAPRAWRRVLAAARHAVHHDPQRTAPAVGHDLLQLRAAPPLEHRQGDEGAAAEAAGPANQVRAAARERVQRDDQSWLAPVSPGSHGAADDGQQNRRRREEDDVAGPGGGRHSCSSVCFQLSLSKDAAGLGRYALYIN